MPPALSRPRGPDLLPTDAVLANGEPADTNEAEFPFFSALWVPTGKPCPVVWPIGGAGNLVRSDGVSIDMGGKRSRSPGMAGTPCSIAMLALTPSLGLTGRRLATRLAGKGVQEWVSGCVGAWVSG